MPPHAYSLCPPRPATGFHALRARSALRSIIATADAAPSDVPVGVLTGLHRDHWAEAFPRLAPGNGEALRGIASSMFALCLDDAPARNHLEVSGCVWEGGL